MFNDSRFIFRIFILVRILLRFLYKSYINLNIIDFIYIYKLFMEWKNIFLIALCSS